MTKETLERNGRIPELDRMGTGVEDNPPRNGLDIESDQDFYLHRERRPVSSESHRH